MNWLHRLPDNQATNLGGCPVAATEAGGPPAQHPAALCLLRSAHGANKIDG